MASELRNGGWAYLRLRPGSLLAWAVPAWAVVCGALASGGFAPTLKGAVRLLLALLLVGAGWGMVWEPLMATDWTIPARRWRHWHLGDPLFTLPYARPGSPGERAARWLAQLYTWGKGVLAPAVGRALGAIFAGLFLSLVLAVALGPEMMMLTLGALALMQLVLIAGRGKGRPTPGWDGLMRLGLPWLAGHLLFAPLTLSSTLTAVAFSIAALGIGRGERGRGWVLGIIGQLGAMLLLILLRRPLTVLLLALLLIPQWLLLTQAENSGYARRAWGWLAAGMFLTALAL